LWPNFPEKKIQGTLWERIEPPGEVNFGKLKPKREAEKGKAFQKGEKFWGQIRSPWKKD